MGKKCTLLEEKQNVHTDMSPNSSIVEEAQVIGGLGE